MVIVFAFFRAAKSKESSRPLVETLSFINMEIRGKVYAKPDSVSGISSRGSWKKAFLVIRYDDGQYPKDILLSSMNKAEEMERVQIGQTGTFKFDARTRMGQNGKWFCELECWGIEIDQPHGAQQPYTQGPI